MEHSSHPKEMADAVAWLQQRVPVVTASLPSEAELRAMGNGDLKRLATSRFATRNLLFCGLFLHSLTGGCGRAHSCRFRGISTSGFLEKDDFVKALMESAKL
jgi:hypothetical protein